MKKVYTPPYIQCINIYIEEGLAQSSTIVNPYPLNEDVLVNDWNLDNDNGIITSDPNNSSW